MQIYKLVQINKKCVLGIRSENFRSHDMLTYFLFKLFFSGKRYNCVQFERHLKGNSKYNFMHFERHFVFQNA